MSDKPSTPATFGGPGWLGRSDDHQSDVVGGSVWHNCGMSDEVGTLREVLISAPSARFDEPDDPDAWLMLSWPERARLDAQCTAIQAYFEAHGVVVHVHRPTAPPPPNYLFMRDLVFMTPQGAVLARPASPVRATEPRWAAQALTEIGVPILCSVGGSATFEGADALWLDSSHVLVGEGLRTNQAGVQTLERVLSEQGVSVQAVPVPPGAQHLLGVVVPIGSNRVLVDADRLSPELAAVLDAHGLDRVDVPADGDNRERRGMNVVVLGPDHLVMPAGCPGLRARFESAGISVDEIPVDAYVQAAGALGCLTSVIRRDGAHSR